MDLAICRSVHPYHLLTTYAANNSFSFHFGTGLSSFLYIRNKTLRSCTPVYAMLMIKTNAVFPHHSQESCLLFHAE